jgi:shikimate dehydrogenase
MKLLGLIGYPLIHSFSKEYFTRKFEWEGINGWSYEVFPLRDIQELPPLLRRHPNLAGLNVTIPHKESVIPFLDEITEEAREVGAVNCIKIYRSPNKLVGYNTDVYGFETSLRPLLQLQHTNALILGTGGASKAVAFVLKNLGVEFTLVSRKPGPGIICYTELTAEIIDRDKLIVNTTPCGMFPNVTDYPPIPYEAVGPDHLMYDLIYNPDETAFIAKGKARGAQVKNGMEMLILQAEKSWEIWNRKD